MLLWYAEDIEPKLVVVNKLSNISWEIEDYYEVSDGTDLFRTRVAASRHIRNKISRPTKVPYLRIVK